MNPVPWRSLWQILNSAIPFAALWLLMLASLSWPYWTTLLLAVPTACLLVRLFIIQHDCGHGSFFRSKVACDLVGGAIGVLTLTPYEYWKREHAIHHATSGLLDKRGHGDIDTLTVDEYRSLGAFARLRYRLYRHPLVLFGVGPAFQFLVLQRLPLNALPTTRKGWWSVVTTNLGIAAVVTAMILLVGVKRFLLVQVPITLLASSLGVWLFYIQHQYEGTYWRRKPDWKYADAALMGSSWYDLGRVLQWFSGNIGLHHIHHLNSKIPNYRLQRCLDTNPELRNVTRLTLRSSLKCARLTLWDEAKRTLVGFSAAKTARVAGEEGT
jgi:omega-6 fatty acid desaturase (delta-12 desaturase)